MKTKVLLPVALSVMFYSAGAQSELWPAHYVRTDIIGAWTYAADIDNNGIPDMLVQAGDTIYWYENILTDPVPHVIDDNFYNSEYALVDVADIDGDGDVDILKGPFFTSGGDSMTWNENLGNGTEWEEHFITVASYYFTTSKAQVGDIDGDGDLDLAVTEYNFDNQSQGALYWMERQDNNAPWIRHDIASGFHWYCHLGDIDNDEDLDLFVSAGGSLFWYENKLPDMDWEMHIIEENPGFWHHFTGFGQDIDQDGDIDLISGRNPEGAVVWYGNPGWEKTVLHSGGQNTAVTCFGGDMDGDGDLDVPLGNLGGIAQALSWSENPGTPGMDWVSHDISLPTLNQFLPTSLADFDQDGDLDLVVLEFDDLGSGASLWVENPLSSSTVTPLFTYKLLQISPNPATHQLDIFIENQNPNPSRIQLFNQAGELLQQSEQLVNKQITLDISALATGVYLVRLVQEDNTVVGKFIKQ